MFQKNQTDVDSRTRRRYFRVVKKIQRISLVVLLWMIGAAVLYGIYTIAFIKPYFEIKTIDVRGELNYLTIDEITAASEIKIGDHLLRLPVNEIQQKLIAMPWVKEAAVHRKLPHLVLIYVKEYKPEAIVRGDGWYYVNKKGVAFKKLESNDDWSYPAITGLEEMLKENQTEEFHSKLLEIMMVKNLYESFSVGETYGLSEIHYSSKRGFSVITMNNPMELRLGFGPFREKLDRLLAVYSAIKSHGGMIAYIDLDLEGKVVVKYGS